MNIIRARNDEQSVITIHAGAELELAVAFSEWLTGQGYEVEMLEGEPVNYPRTPEEERRADALTQLFVRSLPR